MRVHLIKELTVRKFVRGNARSKSSFAEWLAKLKRADWEVPKDIQGTFNTADLLGRSSNRVVFDIGGNNYRVVCKYAFGETQVHLFVCWIGTHAQYTRLCNAKEQYTITCY